jgi:hypothetical protein
MLKNHRTPSTKTIVRALKNDPQLNIIGLALSHWPTSVFKLDAATSFTESSCSNESLKNARKPTTLANYKRPFHMARLQAATTHFTQMQSERHNAAKDNIRRSWGQKMAEFSRIHDAVDVQYSMIEARLNNIIAALQTKTVSIRDRCRELQAAIDAMRRNVTRARAAIELRGTDESAEIQAELRLEMKVNELRTAVQRGQSDLVSIAGRAAKYKELYLKNVAKQRKLQNTRKASERLAEVEGERRDALALLRQRIKDEQTRVQQDINTIRKMRQDLLRQPQSPQKTVRQQYVELLRDAGHAASDDEPVPGGEDSFNSALIFEDSDDEKRFTRQPAREEGGAIQIAFLENNIKTLLATGNYGESDPIIVRLKSQMADIVARRA